MLTTYCYTLSLPHPFSWTNTDKYQSIQKWDTQQGYADNSSDVQVIFIQYGNSTEKQEAKNYGFYNVNIFLIIRFSNAVDRDNSQDDE